MGLATATACLAAIVLATVGGLLLRPGARAVLWAAATVLCAEVVTTAATLATGVFDAGTAVALASGSAPVSVALAAAGRAVAVPRLVALVTAALWGGVLVPLALVGPQVAVALCPPTACVVADFGGALPYVVGLGGFLLVPASAVRMPSDFGPVPARRRAGQLILIGVAWTAFVVWLAALEGALDEYTPHLALAAVLSPAAGAVGWLLVDRIRGVDATVGRALRLGLLAGAGGIIGPVADVDLVWAPLIGLICGTAGALTHDARALRSARVAVRGALTAIVVGVLGLAATGVLGSALGFVFAARVDVLGTQLLAVIATIAASVIVAAPVTLLTSRRGP